MNKILRKVSIIVGLLILVGGIYLSLQLGKQDKPPKEENESTTKTKKAKNYAYSLEAKNESFASEVVISGKVVARQKIDVYSEVTGILNKASKEFREGVYFKKEALMLTIDDTDAKYELQAAKSQLYSALVGLLPDLENDYADNFEAWKKYIDNFDIHAPIQALPQTKSSREKLYIAARNIENQYINIKRQEYRLTKYKIYAPFSGVLSNAMTYEGALVRSGQKLGELTHPSRYEVEATISLYDVPFFKRGNKVRLYSEATDQEWTGRVARLGKTIDESTQTKKVFIAVNSSALNEGMFLNGKIKTKQIENVVKLPRKLLVNEGAVYIIQDGQLQLQTVEVVKIDKNDMYIRGVKDSTKVLAQRLLGAYEGMPVEIIKQ